MEGLALLLMWLGLTAALVVDYSIDEVWMILVMVMHCVLRRIVGIAYGPGESVDVDAVEDHGGDRIANVEDQ